MKRDALLSFVVTTALGGCFAVPAFDQKCFEPVWKWADQDQFHVDLIPPGSDCELRLYGRADGVLEIRSNGLEVGHRCERGSAEACAMEKEARGDGALAGDDEVISCWSLERGFYVASSPDRQTALLVARCETRNDTFVLLRGASAWKRCEVADHAESRAATWKRAAVIAGSAPVWVAAGAFDVTLGWWGYLLKKSH